MLQIKCLDCQQTFTIEDDKQVGEIVECPHCGAEMEITSLEPLSVVLIEEEK